MNTQKSHGYDNVHFFQICNPTLLPIARFISLYLFVRDWPRIKGDWFSLRLCTLHHTWARRFVGQNQFRMSGPVARAVVRVSQVIWKSFYGPHFMGLCVHVTLYRENHVNPRNSRCIYIYVKKVAAI